MIITIIIIIENLYKKKRQTKYKKNAVFSQQNNINKFYCPI